MTGGSSNANCGKNDSRQVSLLWRHQEQSHSCSNIEDAVMRSKKSKEIIHSGHFMVSDFEAEGRDDDDEVSVPVPEDSSSPTVLVTGLGVGVSSVAGLARVEKSGSSPIISVHKKKMDSGVIVHTIPEIMKAARKDNMVNSWEAVCTKLVPEVPAVAIDQSLTKLFQCMTLAYSSKLTSPRWKNFKGLRLQWKDKIRLNNLIWRCWHMQFVERRNTAVCQFASPLDVDQHNKPEAVVLEGKYWKRRLATVTAEYKKWRIFYKNQIVGRTCKDLNDLVMSGELDNLDWSATHSTGSCHSGTGSLALDDDFFMDFSDTLFSSLTSNIPFPFPNPREIAKGAGLADFIQPGLIQLQPNLDDFMDTLEPLHELLSGRLPPVEEENVSVEEGSMQQQQDYGSYTGICSSPNYMPMDMPQSNQFVGTAPGITDTHESRTSDSQTICASNSEPIQENDAKKTSAQQGFAVPTGKPRSRSRSGSAVASLSAISSGLAFSSSQPCLLPNAVYALPNRTHTRNQNSCSSPARLTLEPHIERGGGRLHLGLEVQKSILSAIPCGVTSTSSHGVFPDANLLTRLIAGQSIVNAESVSPPRMLFPVTGVDTTANGNLLQTADREEMEPSVFVGEMDLGSVDTTNVLKRGEQRVHYREHRRVSHINAEQKRRCNIKNGFDMLQSLLPANAAIGVGSSSGCNISGHGKSSEVSKAAMLHRGAEYIKQLRQERQQQLEEMEQLKVNIESLNSAIGGCQAQLPANGVPVARQKGQKMREMFDQWVRTRTMQNWKFWIFSILIQPLLDSYSTAVSVSTYEDVCQNVFNWVDQHCSLVSLRPVVMNSLRHLSKTTDVLTDPSRLPSEAVRAVCNPASTVNLSTTKLETQASVAPMSL